MKSIFKSKVVYKKYLSEDLLLIGFSAKIEFTAGQFFHLILDKNNPDDEKTGFRPYSILNSPNDARSRGVIESFIRLIPDGLASKYLRKLRVSDEVFLRGPYGKFVLDNNNKHVFLCTGTGITPIHSIIEQNIASNNEFILFQGAKNKKELLYYDKFKDLAFKYNNFNYFAILSREEGVWDGLKGRITQHLSILDDFSDKTVYICGLKEFIIDTLSLLRNKSKNIIIERYS